MKFHFQLGQKTASRGKLGIVALWRVTGNMDNPCREHIDSQNEREVRDCGDDTCQQRGNFSLFLRQSLLSVNNKMSSYQATVELDSKSGEQWFWLIAAEMAKVIVEYDPEKAILEESMHSTQELEGLYLDEPLADDNWIAEQRRPNRGARRYKIDLIISKVWTLGKQLKRILCTAIVEPWPIDVMFRIDNR